MQCQNVGGAKASKGTDKLSFCVKSINQSNPLPNVRAHKIEQEIQKTMISFVPKILVGRPLDGLEGIKVHLSLRLETRAATRIDYRQNYCQAHKTSGGGGHECLPAESGGGSSGDGSRDGREGCKTGATGGGVAGSGLNAIRRAHSRRQVLLSSGLVGCTGFHVRLTKYSRERLRANCSMLERF